MIESPLSNTPTQRVIARLRSEGWVDCPNVGFPALSQHPLPNLRQFVVERLRHEGAWMWETDLKLATLIFAIPSHEFQFHPHLKGVLEQLEAEQVIKIQEWVKPSLRRHQFEPIILLKALNVA